MRKSKAVDKTPFKRAAPVTDFLLRFPSFWLLAVLSDLCFAHATPYSLLLFSFSLSSVLLHSPFLSPFLTVSGHETRADLKLTSNSQSSFSVFYFPGWEVPNSILALASPGPHALTGWVPPLSSCCSRCWSFPRDSHPVLPEPCCSWVSSPCLLSASPYCSSASAPSQCPCLFLLSPCWRLAPGPCTCLVSAHFTKPQL